MRLAMIDYQYGDNVHEEIYISTPEELGEYFEWLGDKVSTYISKLMRSKVQVERLDHCITRTHEGGILATSFMKATMNGGSPIIGMQSALDTKFINMMKVLIRAPIAINSVGGYKSVTKDQVLSIRPYQEERIFTHHIGKKTRYINLENDDELEDTTINYLSQVDKDYSYILNLRSYTQKELVNVFKEFKSHGGKIVYLYTTGMDVQQMYDYVEAAVEAGLKKFEFDFNTGTTPAIDQFLDDISDKITVTLNMGVEI